MENKNPVTLGWGPKGQLTILLRVVVHQVAVMVPLRLFDQGAHRANGAWLATDSSY